MEQIEIEYLPKVNDYLEAYSLYEANTTQRKVEKVMCFLFAAVGLIIILFSLNNIRNIIIGLFVMSIGLLDFFGIIDFAKIIIKLQSKKSTKFKYVHKIKFIDEGMEFETNGVKSFIKWEFYKKYYEGKNIFVLVYDNRQYSVFPKEAFNDKIDTFKRVLSEKIKQ